MKSKLKTTGLFYGSLFFAAAILNLLVITTTRGEPLCVALLDFRNFLSVAFVGALMLLSAYIPFLAWVQPIIFLSLTPFPLMTEGPNSFFGLGFFAIGILLLFKLDFFDKHRAVKLSGCVVYLTAIEVFENLRLGSQLYFALTPVLFILAFLVFLYLTFRDKIFVYLKEPKPKFSLESKGLSEAEVAYVLHILAGKSIKDASFEFGVSESTVRNTLARSYKKLGVANKPGLFALVQKFDVVN
jgi:DNA-binding CsgD family transcriptional regulator